MVACGRCREPLVGVRQGRYERQLSRSKISQWSRRRNHKAKDERESQKQKCARRRVEYRLSSCFLNRRTIQDKSHQDRRLSDFQMESLLALKTFVSRKFFFTSNHSSTFPSSCSSSTSSSDSDNTKYTTSFFRRLNTQFHICIFNVQRNHKIV